MELPIVRDPMRWGREIPGKLAPVKKPDFVRSASPVCRRVWNRSLSTSQSILGQLFLKPECGNKTVGLTD
jgi:hypothetical protein